MISPNACTGSIRNGILLAVDMGGRAALRQPKVLIVEDESSLLELYRLALQRAGFAVDTAADGAAGLQQIAKTRPDLVLLDILMPQVDGYQLLRRLKRDVATRDVPVVIFSNLSQKEEIEKGLKLGARDFIIKTSITPPELVAKVQGWVGEEA